MAGSGGQAASVLVATLERAWAAIRRRHPDVPEVVMVMASGSERRALKLGHFAALRWEVDGTDHHEVMVGERACAAARLTCSGLCCTKPPTLWPCPRHRRHFSGRSLPQRPVPAAGRGARPGGHQGRHHRLVRDVSTRGAGRLVRSVIDDLATALVLWRRVELAGGAKTTKNLLACTCDCGRKIRVARGTLEEASIICGRCGGTFTPDEVDT
jgi:hypothetical protein